MSADLILEWQYPAGERHTYRVQLGQICFIGRHPRCEVDIPAPSLARRHTRIQHIDGEWMIEHLRSTTGTYLDGERIDRAILRPGATVQCGEVTLTTRSPEPPTRLPPALPMVSLTAPASAARARSMPRPPLTLGESAASATLTRVDLDRGATHLLDPRDASTLGSHEACEVMLDAPGVLGAHAAIRRLGQHWVAEQVSADAELRVNGERVRSAVLSVGDEIRVGEAVLRFDLLASNPPPDAPAAPPLSPGRQTTGAALQDRRTPPLPGTTAVRPKIVLLAFANDRVDSPGTYLRNLAAERRELSDALAAVAHHHRCRVVSEPEVTTARLFDLLDRHGEDIVALHYGGHGTPDALHFEDDDGALTPLWIEGLAQRLARLPALGLVVLNGCATAGMVEALHACTRACVIATDGAIDDAAARAFARRLWHTLAWGEAVRDAYVIAESEGRARHGEPARAWRMLMPAEASSGWPWRLCSHPDVGEGDRWRLSDRPAGVPTDPTEARIEVDDVVIHRVDALTVQFEVRVRNVGQGVATLNRLRGHPLRASPSASLSDRLVAPLRMAMRPLPVAMPPAALPMMDARPVESSARRTLVRGWGHTLLWALTLGWVKRTAPASAEAQGETPSPASRHRRLPDGTYEALLARYVPPGDYDRFLVELCLDAPYSQLGVTIHYNGGYVALGPTLALDG